MVMKNFNKKINDNIEELTEIILRMHELSRLKSDNFSNEKVKESLKLGSRFDKLLKRIIFSDNGIDKLSLLLDEKVSYVSFIIARYLYPIFPYKTMNIMKKYFTCVDDDLEKMSVLDVINGIEEKKRYF